MATSSLDIAIRADDQASGKLAAMTRSMTADIEAAEKATYDLTHSARERELREIEQFHAKKRALYQKQLEQNLRGEEHARGRMLSAVGQGEAGGAEAEFSRASSELSTIQALRSRNQGTLAVLDAAEAAKRADVAKRAADEQAAIEQAAGQRRATDMEALNKRVFDSTHSWKQREIAAVQERSKKLLAQYKNDAEMRKRIVEAEEADIAAIRSQGGPLTRVAGRILGRGGAAIAGAAAGVVAPILIAAAAGNAARGWLDEQTRLNRDTSAEGGIAARSHSMYGFSDAIGKIPLIGGILGKTVENWTASITGMSKQALAEFADKTAKTERQIDALGSSLQTLAAGADAARTAALGLSKYDQMVAARYSKNSAAESAVSAAGWAGIEARDNLAVAQRSGITGAALRDFEDRAKQAETYRQELMRVAAAEREFSDVLARREQNAERTAFATSIHQREARVLAEGQGLAGRHAVEEAGLGGERDRLRAEEAIIRDRTSAWRDGDKWKADWAAKEANQRIADEKKATGKDVPQAHQIMIRAKAAGDARTAYAEEERALTERRDNYTVDADLLYKEEGLVFRRQDLERKVLGADLAMRSTRARLSGDTIAEKNALARAELKAKHEKELNNPDNPLSPGTPEYERVKAAQDVERAALLNQQARDTAKQRTAWRMEALQSEAATSRSSIAIRDAELAALKVRQDEEDRLNTTGVDLKRKHAAEIAAITEPYRRSREEEGISLAQTILRAGGRSAEAEIVGIRDKYKKMREAAAGDKGRIADIGAAERAEMIGAQRQIAQRGQVSHEVQAYTSRFLQGGQGRNYGQDQLRESQTQTKWLEQIAKEIAVKLGITVNNVSMS